MRRLANSRSFANAVGLLAVVCCAGAATAMARDGALYLAPGGRDDAACTKSDPCRSWERAYELARAGGEVRLAAGDYGDVALVRLEAKSSDERIVFRPEDGASVSVDDLLVDGTDNVEIEDVRSTEGWSVRGMAEHVVMRDVEITNSHWGAWLGGSRDVRVIGGDIGHVDSNDGLHFNATDGQNEDVLIDRLFVHDITHDASPDTHVDCLQAGSVDGLVIRNSRFVNCGTQGVFLNEYGDGSVHDVVVENSWFGPVQDGFTGLYVGIATQVRLLHNSLAGSSAFIWNRESGTTMIGNLLADSSEFNCSELAAKAAQFDFNASPESCSGASNHLTHPRLTEDFVNTSAVNSAAFNLHLRAGAKAIDAGPKQSSVTTDYDEERRPGGAATDIGADEYFSGTPTPTPTATTSPEDTEPPETTIDGAPLGTIRERAATFTFTASEAGSTFECRLDDAAFSECRSPLRLDDLADGEHRFVVRATDAWGNLDMTPAVRTFAVDSAAPAPPAIVLPVEGPWRTSASLTFSGTAEPNATVELFDGAVPRALTLSGLTGEWTVDVMVPDGVHSFTARATDVAGNLSDPSPARTVRVDTQPPAAPVITAPLANAWVRATSATIAGSAEPGTTVELLDETRRVGTALVDASGGWSRAVNDLSEGSHSFTATATDPAGNVGPASAVRAIRVDTRAPETAITAGPTGSTSDRHPQVSFSSSEPSSSFECRLDGPGAQPGDYEGCGSPTSSQTALADGYYTFVVRATDPAGNVDATPATQTFSIGMPEAPSAPVFNAPQDGVWMAVKDFSVSGTAVARSEVRVYDGVALVARADVDAVGAWSATLAGVAEGEHRYAATSTVGGISSPASRSLTVRVDTIAPDTIVTAGPGAVVETRSVSLSFSADETGASFQCRLDGPTGAGTYTACTSPVQYLGLADGAYTVLVRASDPAGNVETIPATRAFTVSVPFASPVISAPANGSWTRSATVVLNGTGEAGALLEILEGPTPRGSTTVDQSGAWSVTLVGVTNGDHVYVARASRTPGGANASSSTRTLRVDTAAPAAPEVAPVAPWLRSVQVRLAGTAEPRSSVTVFEGALARRTVQAADDGTWVAVFDAGEGAHDWHAVSTDAAGNPSAPSNHRTASIDITAPETVLRTGPDGEQTARSAAFAFDAANEAGATFECRLDDASWHACASPQSYADLAVGSHAFSARAIDPAGNVDGSPAVRTFAIVAPATPPAPIPVPPQVATPAPPSPRGRDLTALVRDLLGSRATRIAAVDGLPYVDLFGTAPAITLGATRGPQKVLAIAARTTGTLSVTQRFSAGRHRSALKTRRLQLRPDAVEALTVELGSSDAKAFRRARSATLKLTFTLVVAGRRSTDAVTVRLRLAPR